MTNFTRLITIIALSFASAGFATTYDQIGQAFASGYGAKNKDVNGYWAGRCARADPDHVYPAVMVHKLIDDDTAFPPTRPSFTYYYDTNQKSSFFDSMTPAQVESDPGVKAWFKREQWLKAEESDNSLVSYFDQADGKKVRRALRFSDGQFEKLLVLEVSQEVVTGDAVETTASRYCYFNKFLGKSEDVTPPEEGAFLFGQDLTIANISVKIVNKDVETAVRWVAFDNFGYGSIFIQGLAMTLADGKVITAPRSIMIPAGGRFLFGVAPNVTFRPKSVSMYVGGTTNHFRVSTVY